MAYGPIYRPTQHFCSASEDFPCVVVFEKRKLCIRALVSARGSEQKRKKQKQSPRLKSRLPVPLYFFFFFR